MREYRGSTLKGQATTSSSLTSGWKQLTVDYVTVGGSGNTVDFQVECDAHTKGQNFQVDLVEIRTVITTALTTPPPMSAANDAPETSNIVVVQPVVFPNPTRDEAMLAFSTSRVSPLRVEMYDVSGRVMGSSPTTPTPRPARTASRSPSPAPDGASGRECTSIA